MRCLVHHSWKIFLACEWLSCCFVYRKTNADYKVSQFAQHGNFKPPVSSFTKAALGALTKVKLLTLQRISSHCHKLDMFTNVWNGAPIGMYVVLRTEYLQSSSLSDYFGVGLHCCSIFSARINHVIGEMSFHFHMFFFIFIIVPHISQCSKCLVPTPLQLYSVRQFIPKSKKVTFALQRLCKEIKGIQMNVHMKGSDVLWIASSFARGPVDVR